MSILKPSNDTLITMARLVFEASDLKSLNLSFRVNSERAIVVRVHDDEAGTSTVYETVTTAELLASYVGLCLDADLDKNDAVTTGHRLGRTYR